MTMGCDVAITIGFGVAVITGFGVATPSARAHHSVLPFDGARGTEIGGVVTRIRWRNPHVMIELDVPGGAGAAVHWLIESESPIVLTRLDWTPESIAVGDRLTIVGAPAKDGSPSMRCRHVTLADGRKLDCF